MCKYCEKGKYIEERAGDNIFLEIYGKYLRVIGKVLGIPLGRDVIIEYCPMCRKEAGRLKHILDYGLELENVKENELPDKDNEIIIQFNNILSEKYGLFEVDVLENDNLYFRGRITSSTKSENNAKLKLLIAELNEFYKKYNLKKVIKSMIAYGHTI